MLLQKLGVLTKVIDFANTPQSFK